MKKDKLPNLVVILIVTLLTSVLWVSLTIYRSLTVKPSESVPTAVSNPITPTLDQTAIKKVESGVFLDSSQIPENLGSPAPLISPTASPSATP